MATASVPAKRPAGPAGSAADDTRLQGRRLTQARAAWGILAAVFIVSYLVLLPGAYRQFSTVCAGPHCALVQPTPVSARALRAAGLSLGAYAALTLASLLAAAIACYAIAGVIVWRRSDDRVALLVALAQVAVGGVLVYNAGATRPSPLQGLALAVSLLAVGVQVVAGLLFPNGRFLPRWTRWVAIGWAVAGVALFVAYLRSGVVPYTAEIVLTLLALAVMAWSMWWRYRFVLGPRQRAQTRWVVFGAALTIGAEALLVIPTFLVPAWGRAGSTYMLAAAPLDGVPIVFFAVCLGMAILRRRLYDIDLIINRTLVYGALTATLAALYAAAVIGSQALVQATTGRRGTQPIAIVLSTLLVAALFQPLRRRLQDAIDRRFYRSKYDAARTIEAFARAMRSEVDLGRLSDHLIAVVEQTMQPASLSLWLRPTPPRAGPPDAR